MLWVIIFACIAVAGLVMLASYGVWLTHKAADVMSEVTVLLDQAMTLATLAGQIAMPRLDWGADQGRDLITVDTNRDRQLPT